MILQSHDCHMILQSHDCHMILQSHDSHMTDALLRSSEETLGSLQVLLAYLARYEQQIKATAKGRQVTRPSCLGLSDTETSNLQWQGRPQWS